jgi:hypothetical protein
MFRGCARAHVGLLVAAACVLAGVSAAAQETGAATSATSRSDDIVRLKSGALFRGTISELVPADHVEILLITGETRRFPMADVDYAGAIGGLPARPALLPAPAPPPPSPSTAATAASTASTVRFQAKGDVPELALGEVTGDVISGRGGHTYRTLCTAPCAPDLSPGGHRLVLPDVSTTVHSVYIPFGPSTLQATVTTHHGGQAVGLAVLWVGALGGAGLVTAGALEDSNHFLAYGLTGTGLLIGGLVGGIWILAASASETRLEVLPGLPPSTTSATSWLRAEAPRLDARSPQGLTFRARF